MSEQLQAFLVYDGGEEVHVPPAMGQPRKDQLQGTPAEQLCELAGRVCYDSLGQGRCSTDFHQHILDVRHHSIYRHFNFELEFHVYDAEQLAAFVIDLANRPGVHFHVVEGSPRTTIYASINLQAALEWFRYRHPYDATFSIAEQVHSAACFLAPQVFGKGEVLSTALSEPTHPEHQWISLYLSGGRTFSHEQVRHDYQTAVSQRSTRYCDEYDTPLVVHPLLQEIFSNLPSSISGDLVLRRNIADSECRKLYDEIVYHGQAYLASNGVDKLTARKQARGAARGILGNSLQTEMIFSASVAQWRRMLEQRLTDAADAEIRILYVEALGELRKSRYASAFDDYKLVPAKDGLGEVIIQKIS